MEVVTVKDRAKAKLRRDMGSLLFDALTDANTTDILVNPDGNIWQEQLGGAMRCIGTLASIRTEAIIKTVAGYHQQEVTKVTPLIEGVFPLDGSRFAGQLPPIVSQPTFAIRKKAVAVFTLDDYVANGYMTAEQADIIKAAVVNHKNILISGGTRSGKTTLANAMIKEMADLDERIFIIEDTGEIQCTAVNCVQYYTTLTTDITKLIKVTLRMRPDRIIIGEVRGAEALDLLDAWNTGHEGGLATIHANSAQAAISRLQSLISRNRAAPKDIMPLINEAVHLVVQIVRGPRIKEILTLGGNCE